MTDNPPTGASDVDIIISLQDDDPTQGLRLLLETHSGKVRGWLKKKYKGVLDEAEIESAMNLAAAQIWKFAPNYDESKGTLAGCFLVFARNAAVSVLRGERKHHENRKDYEEILRGDVPQAQPCDAPPPDSKQGKVLSDFDTAIVSLPPLQKSIVLADLKSDGTAEAGRLAERLGISVNSVYVNRNRAHENLHKRMIELGHYRD
jgi:DNA-directed RNA polymerase specialized sigma24 family protein